MRTTGRNERRTVIVDRVLGYTGLFMIGVMAWTCDRLGIVARPPAPRPAIQPVVQGRPS